jgi:hypothetical protein
VSTFRAKVFRESRVIRESNHEKKSFGTVMPGYRLRISAINQSTREIKVRRSLNRAIKRAFQVCIKDSTTQECRHAWSDVEELSNALYDIKVTKAQSTYDQLCFDEPDHEECREYDV